MAEDVESVPDITTQKQLIQAQIGKTMVKGQTWYLIDSKWFKSFKHYVGMDDAWDTSSGTDSHPGPIDNNPLFNDDGSGSIKENLVDELDYVLVPSESWDLLVQWYGTVDHNTAISRQVVENGVFVKHCKVEVYLLELRLCKDFNLENEIRHKFSKIDTVGHVGKTMRKLYEIPDEVETRIWYCCAPNEFNELTKEESTVQDSGLCQNQLLVIETRSEDGSWNHQTKKTLGTYPMMTNVSVSDKSSTAGPSSIMSTRFNPYSYPTENRSAPGLCGLCNLGNTCFMNSVLQCMSNCPPITKYFLNEEHLNELNEENPLGMKGEIAKAFGDLIKVMWSGRYSYTMPHNFKLQVGRFAPQFSGYQQHDSQELLTFLLDGLHEDLNRIKKKPYIELQDASGRPDKDVAKEAWDNYRKRNDSVIVDFFHGLLKSTVVCPDCSKVSVTFDPFCYLSLPLPTKKERALEVLLFHCDAAQKPTRYTVIVPKKGLIRDLVTNVGRLSSIHPDNLIVTEVTRSHFHKFYTNKDALEKIDDKDVIYIYEMPVQNDTHVILPVCLWESSPKLGFSHEQLFGDPLLIAAPRKGCTYDVLYQLVLHKLQRCLRMPDDNSSWWNTKTRRILNGDLTLSEDLPSDENDRSCSDSSDCNGELIQRRLFSFYLVTSGADCSQDIVKIHNDGNPLPFPKHMGQSFIAAKWVPRDRDQVFYDQSLEDIKDDQSTKSNLQTLKLKDCIELYTTREKLGADDAWYCPTCKKHQQATKKFDLWCLPRILIIHLKRFVYNRYHRDKVDRMVQYPVRGLNMSDYVINKSHLQAVYDLIGVCNHYGGLGGGHYTAFCQNQSDHKWYLFDDNCVSEIKEQAVVSSAAYVLFYMRRDSYDEEMELN
ncbi:Ubiquitin carboxyl-terminal hydrolase 15 [Cryptotermes secundus]|uniref:Ubiquitin carboxyl-terminal hydrolase n=1 Tax=Cryptotermes secundus TaxID=105785 RepID=A0A2J7QXP3_9NEOP|nr:ubiquitin carboxyl-terminal hydrolase 15 isoform X2 [Cryptotermes secundus]PNF33355.1 Ubiquitin carboxyl-terminal hydrolase 15 [Cryptotermes secundus]